MAWLTFGSVGNDKLGLFRIPIYEPGAWIVVPVQKSDQMFDVTTIAISG
jgi:hypothetical protein